MKTPAPSPVWTALADPTRRRILDLLRERPRTTGELAEHFTTTRFAVMKNLAVLEKARLVLVRRSGRERWNHLNAVPLQRVYERWVKPYEAVWASKSTGLKTRLGGANMPTEAVTSTIEQVELEIEIAAPPARVWKALTEETTFWWPRDFYTNPKTKSFHLEPKLGGKMYEDWGGGEGLVWYRIFGIATAKSLDLEGCMGVPYGPAHTLLHLELEKKGGVTILKLSDSTIGKIGHCGEGTKLDGWKQVFEIGLKSYVERVA